MMTLIPGQVLAEISNQYERGDLQVRVDEGGFQQADERIAFAKFSGQKDQAPQVGEATPEDGQSLLKFLDKKDGV